MFEEAEYCEFVPIRNKNGICDWSAVDCDDYDEMMKYSWNKDIKGYARTNVKNENKWTSKKMHRMIMNTPEGMCTDHKNHDKLNNCTSNLRICTSQENNFNKKSHKNSSSKYKGVSWKNRENKWETSIMANGISKFIGHYDSEEEAARAYDTVAKEKFGEFVKLNFPNE